VEYVRGASPVTASVLAPCPDQNCVPVNSQQGAKVIIVLTIAGSELLHLPPVVCSTLVALKYVGGAGVEESARSTYC
jgi:CRISPR/Cas system CMR-associated protein Cmr1 (group 7 of RAMP superfamily)